MATTQKNNTIILEMSGASKDDMRDLRYGEGKLFNRVARAVEQLKEAGEVALDAQPVVIVVKQKKDD